MNTCCQERMILPAGVHTSVNEHPGMTKCFWRIFTFPYSKLAYHFFFLSQLPKAIMTHGQYIYFYIGNGTVCNNQYGKRFSAQPQASHNLLFFFATRRYHFRQLLNFPQRHNKFSDVVYFCRQSNQCLSKSIQLHNKRKLLVIFY